MNAKRLLISTSRQYQHNTGNGFVFGYDADGTEKIVTKLLQKNKALKEELKTTQDIAFELTESLRKEGIELEKLKEKMADALHAALEWHKQLVEAIQSRDELLEAYKEHRSDMCRLGVREELIEKAESKKEKESK